MSSNEGFLALPLFTREAELRRVWCKGKRTITPSQRVWVRYMLTVWGSVMGGSEDPRGPANVIGRLMVRTRWDDDTADRIVAIVNLLHEEGLRGTELFTKARDYVLPASSAANLLAQAEQEDDAKFIESLMVKCFRRGSPMQTVAVLRYCGHQSVRGCARELVRRTGCDIQWARKRIEWCEKILEEEIYYAVRREQEAVLAPCEEKEENSSKKIAF